MYRYTLFFTLLTLSCFASQPSVGQQRFQPGYVIKINGDTVQGYVQNLKPKTSPKQIQFKASSAASPQVFNTNSIKGFSIRGKLYGRASITSSDNQGITSLFLEILVQGDKSLYRYDARNQVKFYIRKGNTYELLGYQPAQQGRPSNERYKGQLALYLQKCASIRSKLKYLTYDTKSLTRGFIKYYKCVLGKETFQSRENTIVVTKYLKIENLSKAKYLPGYIVKTSGDTISGYIKTKKQSAYLKKIQFKEKDINEEQTHDISTLVAFNVENKHYVKARVQIDTIKYPRKLTYDSKLYLANYTVFLEALVGGVKSLYYFKGPYGIKQFYIKEGDKYELLKYKKYFKNDKEGGKTITEDLRYKGQLQLYLNDCKSIKNRLEATQYSRVSLIRTFLKYYKCTRKKNTFNQAAPKTLVNTGLTAGISNTTIGFKVINRFSEPVAFADFSNSTNFSGGLFLELVFPGKRRNFSLYNELAYSNYQSEGTYAENIGALNIKYRLNIEAAYLKVYNLLRFMPRASADASTYVFFNVGVANGAALRLIDQQTSVITSSVGNVNTNERSLGIGRRGVESSLVFGLGLKINKVFSLETRYELGDGFTSNTQIASRINRLFFLLGVHF